MKDNSQIYEIPPRLLPNWANSLTLTIDYTGMDFADEAALKDAVMRDNILANVRYQLQDGGSVHYGNPCLCHTGRKDHFPFQGTPDEAADGAGLWYLQSSAVKEVLLHGDRYIRACDSIGYTFRADGIGTDIAGNRSQNFSIRYPASWQKICTDWYADRRQP